MTHLSKSKVTLRIMGEELIPDEISKLLGSDATHYYKKGDVFKSKSTGNERIEKIGMWRIQATEQVPENIDAQILEIIKKLTNDLNVWKSLSSKYEIDLFCGLFMKESNEGLEISPSSLKILGERGILLALDIYDPDDDI